VETEAEKILGSFGPKEYGALTIVKLSNGGHLNHVFEQMELLMLHALFPAVRPPRWRGKSEKLRCQRNQL
jgi:hypothetical protein